MSQGAVTYHPQDPNLPTMAKPVTYERRKDLGPDIDLERVPPKVLDKPVSKVVEVFRPVPVDKVVERLRERAVIRERCEERPGPIFRDEFLAFREVTKEVAVERLVHRETVQEVIVDKFVDLIVEVIREVPISRVLERKVEVRSS